MVGRWRHGASLTKADRSHLHYLLVDQGMSPRIALTLLLAYASACVVVGLALESAPESLSLLVFLVVFIGHCGYVLRRRRDRQSALQRS